MEKFVKNLESLLGCKRHSFNVDDLWEATRPEGQAVLLDKAMGSVSWSPNPFGFSLR